MKGNEQTREVLKKIHDQIKIRKDRELIAEKLGYNSYETMRAALNNSIYAGRINWVKLVNMCQAADIKLSKLIREVGL